MVDALHKEAVKRTYGEKGVKAPLKRSRSTSRTRRGPLKKAKREYASRSR